MKRAVDSLLKDAVSKGDVPGVVAVATDAKGNTYEGGFGKRVLGHFHGTSPPAIGSRVTADASEQETPVFREETP